MADIYRILCLLALIISLLAQLSRLGGYCLENCASCDPNAISKCTGSHPCQQGFYDPSGQGVCKIHPSLQISFQEMNKRTKNQITKLSWGEDSMLSKCTYEQKGIKQQIDILGLFQGSASIEKQFKLPKGNELVEIRFSLVRDDWLPFNDFLSIEIVDGSEIINTYEISYQERKNLTSYEINMNCEGKKVIIERYNLKIDKTITQKLKNDTLKVVFSSFLYDSVWGIINLQIITGCVGFTKQSEKSGSCSSCAPNGFFLSTFQDFGACKNCPQLCKTCISEDKCLQCNWGKLVDGKCQISQAYKFQQIDQKYFNSTCNNYHLLMSSNQNKIVLPLFQNPSNNLYDQVFPVITVYYDPFDVKRKEKITNQIVLKINEQIVKRVSLHENKQFVDSCKLFTSQRMAKIMIVGPLITINDNKLLISLEAEGITNFGIGKVLFYSLDKIQKDQDLDSNKISQNKQILTPKQGSAEQKKANNKKTIEIINNPLLLQSTSVSKDTEFVNSLKQNNNSNTISQKVKYLVSGNGSLIFSIFGITSISGKIEVQIEQLQLQDYKISDTYFIEDILMIELNIFKSFKKSKIVFKQVTQARILQQATRYLATVQVTRFDVISQSQLQSIFSLQKTFQVFAWLGILAIILSVITGFGVVIEEYIVTLQLIYLHIYLGYNILPLSFSHAISGLRGATILDFFNPLVINMTPWPLNSEMLYKLLPNSFNFSYAFFPLLLTLLSYFVWFIALVAVKKWLLPRDIPDQQRETLHKIVDGVVCRVMNYVDTIWRYQLIAVFLLCFRQFAIFQQQANSGQLAFSIFILVIQIGWIIFSEYYVRQQYYQCQYSYFLFKFQDRFFCRLPQHSLPSRHHRIGYPLLRMAKALIFVLATFNPQPIVSIIIYILINSLQLWYVLQNSIFCDSRMLKFKLIQGLLFIFLEFIMLVLVSAQSRINVDKYIGWGFFLGAVGLLIVINGLIRIGFSIWLKYMQMKDVNFQEVELDQKKLQTKRAV